MAASKPTLDRLRATRPGRITTFSDKWSVKPRPDITKFPDPPNAEDFCVIWRTSFPLEYSNRFSGPGNPVGETGKRDENAV
jgi:hypothetical protein